MLQGIVAVVMVYMPIYLVYQMVVVFSKRKLLYNEIQTMFDHTLFSDTHPLF